MERVARRPLPGADRSSHGAGLRAFRDDLQAASLHVLPLRLCGALLSARLAARKGAAFERLRDFDSVGDRALGLGGDHFVAVEAGFQRFPARVFCRRVP